MAHPNSTLALVQAGLDHADLQKGSGDGQQLGIPKSWFNDPYALMDSMGLGYRSNPSAISYETLKQMSEKNSVVSAIVQTRVNQVASFCQPQRNKYSVGFRIQHRDQKRKLTDSEKEHITHLERFIQNMGEGRDPGRDSFETWARKVVRDRLVYDQLVSEKVLRRNGRPFSIHAVDSATYRIAPAKTRRGAPLTKHEQQYVPQYVQVIDGTIVNEFTRRELIFRVANPRTDLKSYGYGLSELELLINTVTSHLWAEEWNRKVFSQGSTVKGILNVQGKVPAPQMEAFRRQWLTQVSSVSNAWRTPVMNSDNLQWIPLQPSNNDMGFQQWLEYLIKIACAVYLIDPAEINFDSRGGVGSQPMFMTTNEAQQKVSKDRGLQPLLRFLQNTVNEEIIWEMDEDYEFLFVGLDARSESEAIELRMKELGSYKTLNEIRREADELAPVEHGDTVMNPTYIGLKNQLAMQAQQQAGPPGGMPGMPGAPGGAPGGAPEMPPGLPSGGRPPSHKEMFEQQFGPPNKPPQPGQAERRLGGAIEKDAQTPAPGGAPAKDEEATPNDEHSFSREETSDVWEETIHASLPKNLAGDLKKALSSFRDL
jgi:hypothetical protein